MSEIKAGDTVMIVKPHKCCGKGVLGFVFEVQEIASGPGRCLNCGHKDSGTDAGSLDGDWVALDRLKKIRPLNELEDQTEERKVEV